ncbi:uncharacterized protein LOC107371248 [Tetranychus urticae]|uniref:BACK domain-containing protein n=1 Tax=Tetranychus urticae TaxID=32264 RepID=T1JYB0_TETUR|nr:uncharacterized protein LOC107371248 [Tetranychus urticae]
MDSLKTDDQLTINNRRKEYKISKKLIRKVPYFEKMLSHDLKESKENKVELDFDEQALKEIFHCLEFGYMFIEMESVMNLCNMIDYFGMDNDLMDECVDYFHDNFTIEHLPVVMPQVTATSKCINSEALNGFICRHFLKISNTTAWLHYPIEIVEYILNLNLMIHSEKQVFDAIFRWINGDSRSRMRFLRKLLNLVRWYHLEDLDLSEIKKNKFFNRAGSGPVFWLHWKRNCHRAFNRAKQNYFIMIEHVSGTNLHVKVIDSNFIVLFVRKVELDKSMPLHVFHNKHVSDIIFDSGRRGIRIDWSLSKYRWLDLSTFKCPHLETIKCIYGRSGEKNCSSDNLNKDLYLGALGSALLETTEKFILIYDGYFSRSLSEGFEKYFHKDFHDFHVTFLDDHIYVLNRLLVLTRYDTNYCPIEWTRFENTRAKLADLLLTSSQANDNRVFLANKITKDIHCYNIKSKKWSSIHLKINNGSIDCRTGSNELLAFTSAFLSIDAIGPYMNPELS